MHIGPKTENDMQTSKTCMYSLKIIAVRMQNSVILKNEGIVINQSHFGNTPDHITQTQILNNMKKINS
jgi:hypothetical protein